MRDYLVFVVQRTVKLGIMDGPSELKHPILVCVFSGRCTEAYAKKQTTKYKEAYYVEASKHDTTAAAKDA